MLRPTLLFGLLEALATNVRRQTLDVRLFEIGRVFEGRGAGELPREDTRVGVVLTGLRAPRAWHAPRARVDVFDVKGAVEGLVEALGRGEVGVEPARPRTSRTGAPRRCWSRARRWGRWASSTPTSSAPSTCRRRSTSRRCRSTRWRPCRAARSSTGPSRATRGPAGPRRGPPAERAVGGGRPGDRGDPAAVAQPGGALRRLRGRRRSGPVGRASPTACSTRRTTGRSPTPRSTGRTPRSSSGFGPSSAPRCAAPTGPAGRGMTPGRHRPKAVQSRPSTAPAAEDDPMTDDAQARLALLEQHVQRAIELIGTLRAENARLTAERRAVDGRVADLTAEAEGLRTRLAVDRPARGRAAASPRGAPAAARPGGGDPEGPRPDRGTLTTRRGRRRSGE